MGLLARPLHRFSLLIYRFNDVEPKHTQMQSYLQKFRDPIDLMILTKIEAPKKIIIINIKIDSKDCG